MMEKEFEFLWEYEADPGGDAEWAAPVDVLTNRLQRPVTATKVNTVTNTTGTGEENERG